MPLPGERQGTSGATAGSDSMRVGSDHQLSRRAMIGKPEATTAETSTKTNADLSSGENQRGTTQTGPPEQQLQEDTSIKIKNREKN